MELRNSGNGTGEKALSEKIIGAAIAVHRELGPGFLESVYETALALEFAAAGVQFERQKLVPIFYRGELVGEHRLDFLIEKSFVLELKAISEIEPIHFAMVRSYMKAVGATEGLLLNFATMPLTIKRVGREGSYRKDVGQVRLHDSDF